MNSYNSNKFPPLSIRVIPMGTTPRSHPFVATAGCCLLLCLCSWHLPCESLFWLIVVFAAHCPGGEADNNTANCQSGAVEEDGNHHQSGVLKENATYPHGGEAKDNADYCHDSVAKDDATYCCGGMADSNAG